VGAAAAKAMAVSRPILLVSPDGLVFLGRRRTIECHPGSRLCMLRLTRRLDGAVACS
jgi:hypothetical protein